MKETFIISEERGCVSEENNHKSGGNSEAGSTKISEKTKESLSSYYLVVLFFYLTLLGYLTSAIDDAMPAVVTDKEAGLTKFSEERAWRYLETIVGLGPRVAGTKYHLEKTVDLKNLLEDVRRNATQNVKVDWQFASGSYWIGFRHPFVNIYNNISNLIAVIEGESGFNADGSTNSSLLFNCHYDSVPTSPGVSDNALFCAVMVEVLSIMSQGGHKFKHNIVFLFNGAEENPLQGAHGFLSHPWSRGVTALVNLDSAGINCKSTVFQVSDPRVVSSYRASVSLPSAQAFAEPLFSTGLIPSDTDFRIFRDFANIYGLDMAFSKNGHVYHTRNDALSTLQRGVTQHSGDVVLALATEMADNDVYKMKLDKPSTTVYWDYLSLMMFTYDFNTAFAIDLTILFLGLASVLYYLWIVGFRRTTVKEFVISIFGRLLSCAVGCGLLWLCCLLAYLTTSQLRYLSHSWIVVPIYWVPFLIGAVSTSQTFDSWRCKRMGLGRVRRFAQSMAATRLIVCFLLLAMILTPNSATLRYLISIPLLLMTLASYVSLSVVRSCQVKTHTQCIIDLLLSTPALMFFLVMAVKLNTLMGPIMARSPTLKPDFTFAALNTGIIVLACLPLSGIELLFSRGRMWLVVVVFSLSTVVLCVLPMSPYREGGSLPAVQRHYWFHTEIISYDINQEVVDKRSGIWFAHTEVHTPQSVILSGEQNGYVFKNVRSVLDDDCVKYSYCNLPTLSPRMVDKSERSIWVDFDPPNKAGTGEGLTLNNRSCEVDVCTLQFSVIGAPHMSCVLWPRAGVSLSSWSVSAPETPTAEQAGRPLHYMYISRGTYSEEVTPFVFSVDFKVTNGSTSDPLLDVSLSSHRISHEEEFTEAYVKLTKTMPSYFNIASSISFRYNYVF